jgi:hypothetical protein
MNWRKTSYSGNGGENCVEVGDGARSVLVRDTKERNLGNARTVLTVSPEAWAGFTRSIR